jgi:hypothetical protein
LGYLAKALINAGHKVESFDIWAHQYDDHEVVERIKDLDYDIVGIGALSTQYSYVKWLVSQFKKHDKDKFGVKRSFIWDRVCSDSDACRGAKCGYYGRCFYFRARKKWETALIVVANHALIGIGEG